MFQKKANYSFEELLACGRGELFGPGNAQLPLPPMLMFDRITHIDSEGGAPIDLTADVDLLRRYSEGLQAWREELAAYCSSHDIAYVPLETSLPIDELLLSLLRRRGVVR